MGTFTDKLEIAFATQPMAAIPVWTDVSAYLRPEEIRVETRGRPDEFSEGQPCQFACVVDNTDGRFTQNLPTSPYYPNVRIGRRLRWSRTYSGSARTYVRFDGHVNEFPTAWQAPGGQFALAVITATDRLKRFGQVGELRSMVEEEILRETVTTLGGGATSLISDNDSGFEAGISNWAVGGGGTITATSEQAHSGSQSMKAVLDGTGGGLWAKNDGNTFAAAQTVSPGQILSTGAWFRAGGAAGSGTSYNKLIGFFTDTDEHYQLTDPATVPTGEFAYVSLHWNVAGIAGRIAAIRAANPGVKLLAYQNLGGMIAGPHTNNRPTTLVTQEQAAGHGTGGDDWRLHKASDSSVIVFNDFTYLQAAHIGRASYRTQATGHFAGIKADGFDGVFLDDVNTHPGHGFDTADAGHSSEFASDVAYRDAMVDAMGVLASAARAQGLLVVANVGVDPWTASQYDGYLSLLTNGSLDGACREFWINWGSSAVYYDGATWSDTMKYLTDAEAAGAWAMVNSYPLTTPDAQRSIRYGLASFYLHWNGTAPSGFGYNDGRPIGNYGDYRSLIGTPTEAKQLVSGTTADGAWMRHYTGGVAIANAKSTAGVVTFTLGGTYLDPSGTPVTSVGLDTKRGMVLLTPTGASARAWQPVLRYLDSLNNYVTQDNGPPVTVIDTAWTEGRHENRTVPSSPAGIAKVLAQVQTANGTVNGEVDYVDDMWLQRVDPATQSAVGPSAYYPLSEPDGATRAGNMAGSAQQPARIVQRGTGGELNFGQGTGPGFDQLPAPMFTPVNTTNGKYLAAALTTPIGGAALTLEGFFLARDSTITGRAIAVLETPSGIRVELQVDTGGRLRVLVDAYGLSLLQLASAIKVNDGHTHHAAVTLSVAGTTATTRLYLDGVQVNTGWARPLLSVGGFATLWIGGHKTGRLFDGTLSHVAAHSVALSPARIADHAHAGLDGLAGERTDQRIGRIADWAAIPPVDRDLDTGDGTVGAQATAGQQPTVAMRQAEAAESGVLFISGDGKLTFHRRSRRYNTTPAFTLDVAQGHLADELTFPGDDFGLVNDMTVTRAGGTAARAVNQASIDEHGLYRDSAEIACQTDDQAFSAAGWRVNSYGTPLLRVPSVTVDLVTLDRLNPGLAAAVLAATISTRFRITGLPAQAPTAQIDLMIEGISETVRLGRHLVSFNCSPASVWDVWQLGVAGHSELGVTTRVAQ